MNIIKQVFDETEKKSITRDVLEALPDWFGIQDSREKYIKDCIGKSFFCAYDENHPIGFLYLKETSKDTVEIAVMGILKEYHRQGIGKKLFDCAKEAAYQNEYSFMQVKTVEMGKYEDYDRTNRFYISLGFKEFEVFPTLWDEWNPCQIYVMALR
ncbi:MAG TPA: GNAT family N-acetyltransferase [Lachnospiraceae bacterium]|nr:GNAT family N-acetyltransferase [Lachnospiraceae bacterium]